MATYTRHKTKNKDIAFELRKQGFTFAEIGEKLGISKQRVAQYFTGQALNDRHFVVKKTACKYPNLRNWLNKEGWSMARLLVQCGYEYDPETARWLTKALTGSGYSLSYDLIKKILNATGLTFEECFYLEDVDG